MWSYRLFWRLFLVYGGLNFALASLFPLALSHWQESVVIAQARQRLQSIAVILRDQVANDLEQDQLTRVQSDRLRTQFERWGQELQVRITLIAADGSALVDSDETVDRMQNHANRPEIVAARETGSGDTIRHSPTLGIRMLYLALPVERAGMTRGYIRVAVELQSIESQVRARQRTLWLCAMGLAILAVPVTYFLVRQMLRPLTRLASSLRASREENYEQPVTTRGLDELSELARDWDEMRVDLLRRITQLDDQNKQMSTVLGGMVEGVLAVDADRRVLLANRACRGLLGISTPDVAGRTLLEVARNVEIDVAVNDAVNSDQPYQKEITLTGPPRRVISLFATRLRTGPTRGAVVVLHDITELRRLENLRREFVANVSHELKTPLASIKAYAETLQMGALNDPEHGAAFVDRIAEQAELLHQLIMDLLHLARVEAGQEAFDFADIEVAPIAERAIAQVKQVAEQKRIEMTCVPPDQPLAVWADADGVFTIVSNLLGNAVKYTQSDGKVRVKWYRDQNEVVLEFDDTGIGIAPEDQERVFERFYRVQKARSRELGGTGLGLAIVKHLAQSFGGSVSLQSQPGVGSTFRVRLPAAQRLP